MNNNTGLGLVAALKNNNIKDVIYMLAKAFYEIPHTTLKKKHGRKLGHILRSLLKNLKKTTTL